MKNLKYELWKSLIGRFIDKDFDKISSTVWDKVMINTSNTIMIFDTVERILYDVYILSLPARHS